MLKFKEIIKSNGLGYVLTTLTNGTCCVVDINNNTLTIEILLDSFLKWQAFDINPSPDEINKANEILLNPSEVYYGPLVMEYLSGGAIKHDFDELKKAAQYNY